MDTLPAEPPRHRSWLTDKARAEFAEIHDCEPERVEEVLDNRDRAIAKARERIEYEDPMGWERGRRW